MFFYKSCENLQENRDLCYAAKGEVLICQAHMENNLIFSVNRIID